MRRSPVVSLLVLMLLAAAEPAFAQRGTGVFRMEMESVRVERQREPGGDRPYFAVIHFRSQFVRPNSTVVEVRSREPHDWVSKPGLNRGLRGGQDHMMNGNALRLPWWMGSHEWRAIRVGNFATTADAATAQVVGAIVVALDNNNTPPHVVRGVLDRMGGVVETLLRTKVERGGLLRDLRLDATAISQNMPREITQLFMQSLSAGDILELLFQLTAGSTFSPDAITGIQVLLFPALDGFPPQDSTVSTTLLPNKPVKIRTVVAPITSAQNQVLRFEGSDAIYDVPVRFQYEPERPAHRVRSLAFALWTGDDDLREQSEAWAVAVVGGREIRGRINGNGERLPDRSQVIYSLDLPAGTTVRDITSVGIDYVSRKRSGMPFDEDDKWKLDALHVSYMTTGSNVLATVQGRPLSEFTVHNRQLRVPLR